MLILIYELTHRDGFSELTCRALDCEIRGYEVQFLVGYSNLLICFMQMTNPFL